MQAFFQVFTVVFLCDFDSFGDNTLSGLFGYRARIIVQRRKDFEKMLYTFAGGPAAGHFPTACGRNNGNDNNQNGSATTGDNAAGNNSTTTPNNGNGGVNNGANNNGTNHNGTNNGTSSNGGLLNDTGDVLEDIGNGAGEALQDTGRALTGNNGTANRNGMY